MRKLVAILRGIEPDETFEIAEALIDTGIGMIEVPINSPQPFNSIEQIAAKFGNDALIGGGTLLSVSEIEDLTNAGGRLAVSPDCNPEVIKAAKAKGMVSFPGVFTPTECFTALRSGADGLKIFPSFLMGEEGLKALRAVLPPETQVFSVGGADAGNFTSWLQAGANGFGIGHAIYKPGASAKEVTAKATELVRAYDKAVAA